MPNHCETEFSISGRRADVQAVLDAHFTDKGELDCDKVIPYPEKYMQMDALREEWNAVHCDETGWRLKPEFESQNLQRPSDGFNSGGYEWCCSAWGTKWGTYDGGGVVIVISQ